MIVVCNSTVLIGLSRIGKLGLLENVFGQISIPGAVFAEVAEKGLNRPGAKAIKKADWIKVKEIKDRSHVSFLLGTHLFSLTCVEYSYPYEIVPFIPDDNVII